MNESRTSSQTYASYLVRAAVENSIKFNCKWLLFLRPTLDCNYAIDCNSLKPRQSFQSCNLNFLIFKWAQKTFQTRRVNWGLSLAQEPPVKSAESKATAEKTKNFQVRSFFRAEVALARVSNRLGQVRKWIKTFLPADPSSRGVRS